MNKAPSNEKKKDNYSNYVAKSSYKLERSKLIAESDMLRKILSQRKEALIL